MRHDGRGYDQLRPVSIERHFVKGPQGAVLVSFGDTKVICTATVEERVPAWLKGGGRGWVTAEYAMLPGSASEGRISRDSVNRGRAQEISRLIGRSLRAVTDLTLLGERQITVDCDVIQADGGTRTAAVTGGYVALADAIDSLQRDGLLSAEPLHSECAAVSVGLLDQTPHLDLCYVEDAAADVDLNLVMTSGGGIVEVQSTAEGAAMHRAQLDAMMDLGAKGIEILFQLQREALARE